MRFQGTFWRRGMIITWSGSVASIPAGWTLCDGGGGAPELRNRFIVAAGAGYNPDDTGGAVAHDHTVSIAHTHTIGPGNDIATGVNWNRDLETKGVDKTTSESSSMPPYYALCYIMKL